MSNELSMKVPGLSQDDPLRIFSENLFFRGARDDTLMAVSRRRADWSSCSSWKCAISKFLSHFEIKIFG